LIRKLGAGPWQGILVLGAVFLLFAAIGLAEGEVAWYLVEPAPIVAAVLLNACTWIAALLDGNTSRFRPGWLLLAGIFASSLVIARFQSGRDLVHRDLDLVVLEGMRALGFPATMIRSVVPRQSLPTLGDLWSDLAAGSVLVGLGYLQAFVVLPLLSRLRRGKPKHIP
jgi:hypothetical protein